MGSRPGSHAAALLPVVALLCCAGCGWAPEESADIGRALYAQNGCAGCHGAGGSGDGPISPRLAVRPADLRNPQAFRNGADVAAIAHTLATGIASGPPDATADPRLHHHVLLMPRFDHLTEPERRSLAMYVRSLAGQSFSGATP